MEKRIEEILDLITRDKTLTDSLAQAQKQGKHLNITGFAREQKAYVIAALARLSGRKPVVIVPDSARAREMAKGLNAFTEGGVSVLQPSEMSLVTAEAASRDLELSRCVSLSNIITGDYGAVVIASGALLNKLEPAKKFKRRILTIKTGKPAPQDDLLLYLRTNGYERVPQVSQPGEYACRGDIVDVFVPGCQDPYRISLFDDEVEKIKSFDRETQRSVETLDSVRIVPSGIFAFTDKKEAEDAASKITARAEEDISHMKGNTSESRKAAELLTRTAEADAMKITAGTEPSGIARWIGVILKDPACVLDYLDYSENMFFADEMIDIDARMNGYAGEYAQRCQESFMIGMAPTCAPSAMHNLSNIMKRIDGIEDAVTTSCLQAAGNGLPGGISCTVTGLPSDSYAGRNDDLAALITKDGGKSVYLMASYGKRTDSLKARLAETGCFAEVTDCALPVGFSYPALGITLLGEQELFGSDRIVKPKKKGGNRIAFFSDIHPGDYIVHDTYGIGRYEGLVNKKVGEIRKDYLKIVYAKDQVLYILPENIDMLQKYVGPGDREPKLTRLGGDEWKRSVSRARESIKKVAYDLLKLYAARSVSKGFACDPDDENQRLFEERFPFVETEDQARAIREIKADMESELPMDRLLCGDVGFGKTEVAFRAMFKAVMNGKQVILLAPTTLLAQQHYDNFRERCKGLPINVNTVLLSRFVTPAKIKESLQDIAKGKADVIIGTHRVLSNDVRPPHLGLLVVDEEQRFGVNHKEKIKSMRNNVDVLTLSATPIPRTLNMSLAGIRDMSMLVEAPFNRREVQTYVMGYDEQIIVQACMREISRGGQVFYLYNRTANIDLVARNLAELMPDARVIYAHGQMGERELENIIADFIKGKYDILVCTTIIENGVDMPNVNTLIVEDADRFGLAQLYQLKGRVGRSDRQAYAYITYDASAPLKEEASKRLEAIREFTELGSGVKVAIRDLEVRGAGSLLGAEQHGQMDVIGYELYCRMLDEEIKAMKNKGEDVDFNVMPEQEDTSFVVEVDYDAYIPSSYIEDEAGRMTAYRRIGSIRSFKDYDDFLDEICDRYGQPPAEIYILAGIALTRAEGRRLGFTKVSINNTGVRFYLNPMLQLDMQAMGALFGDKYYGARCQINATGAFPFMQFKPSSVSQSKTVEEIVGLLKLLSDNKTGETVA